MATEATDHKVTQGELLAYTEHIGALNMHRTL